MKLRLLSSLIALAGASLGIAQEQELAHSYNFFDVGYERTSFQESGDILSDGHGIATDFALSPRKSLLFAGEFHWSRPDDFNGEGVNTYDIKLGAGFYLPIGKAKNISFYTHVGPRYLKAETGLDIYDPSDWGLYVEPGIRVNLTGNWEIYGAYEYTSIFDSNFNAGKVGMLLHFSENLAVEAFGRFDDKWAHSYGGGLRLGW